MNLRRALLIGALALGMFVTGVDRGPSGLGDVPAAQAKGTKPAPKRTAKKKPAAKTKSRAKAKRATSGRGQVRSNRTTGTVKLCKEVVVGKGKRAKKRRKCSRVKEFQGHSAGALQTGELTQGTGVLKLRSENLQESLEVSLYQPDGSYDEAALAQLDSIFRCKRTQEVRAMDPRLYDQLARISDHFGGKEIEIVSGFRFAERSSSRHYHASAMDLRIKGVSTREMYAYAQSLDRGGMGIGIYPHSGFIHVDFRAPGEASYRWTDYSGPGGSSKRKAKKKAPGRTARAKRPTS